MCLMIKVHVFDILHMLYPKTAPVDTGNSYMRMALAHSLFFAKIGLCKIG